MEKQLNEIYYKIAYKVIDMIPVKWDKVYLLGSVSENQSSYGVTFYFIDSATKDIVRVYDIAKKYEFPEDIRKKLLYELSNIIFELNKCFVNNGQEQWYHVEFTMEPSGKFDINFNYDVDMDILGTFYEEVVWVYGKLGYKFGDSYDELLSEYYDDVKKK